jgi:hypothetical protein
LIYKSINFNKKHLNSYIYKPCLIIKGKRKPYNYFIKLGKYNLDLAYSDIISLILIKGYNSSRYLITFTYNRLKLIKVYFIKTKGEVYNYFIYFKKHFKWPNLS